MSFHLQLKETQDQLTTAQNRAAQYILDHYDEAIFLTASRLAKQAGVSEATIVRLAQVLGFEGYPKMQQTLRDNLRNQLSTVARLTNTVRHIRGDGDILTKTMQEDMHNLAQTLRDISLETFHQALMDMVNAKRIFVAGLRGAHAPALVLAFYLQFLKMDAHAVTPGYGDVWNTLQDLCPKDLVIGISFPRYTKLTVEILEYAHEQGAKVGAITDSLVSPLARNADWVLLAYSKLDSFIESFTASMSVVNALLTALSIQKPGKTLNALKDREVLWRKRDIYINPYIDKYARGKLKRRKRDTIKK
jgi:DNA-binding MurR/RpiR family transcriptional regulator